MNLDKSFSLPMRSAQAFWRDKVLLDAGEYKLLATEAKARAFAISTMTKGDELQTVFNALQRAIDDGVTFKDFQADSEEVMVKRGFDTAKPWRLANIFQTNIQTAYNVGRYEQLQSERDVFPYWMYDAINDVVTRKKHLDMDGRAYPVDDPIWNSWYPPNGYG
jgi:SPP1 gp7 family putative phage head morphogenesis protein